ncbi:peptidase c1a, papain [hydrocarbon metagenome]|uniref:Peptidase c1a, papain n=1 Tax=hydrocarbon metagenome TaxID=938273 RepID=A0A0W8GAJ8_9ZZZZ
MIRRTFVSAVLLCIVLLGLHGIGRAEPIPFGENDTLEEIREKIRHNGYHFTVAENPIFNLPPAQRRTYRSRRASLPPAENARMAASSLSSLPKKALPSSFDWRDRNGRSYIGPIRNQGSCGSCYAFGAVAAAEGVYNAAMDRYDANAADFSESFIAWCLGEYGPYSDSFNGCDGADYDYAELLALTVQGVTWEANFPYTPVDPGSCTHWADPVVRFNSWGRCGCNDIDAIKTAIMTHGVIDVAVYAGSAFDAYASGIYEDTLTTCPGSPCSYTETNHAVALVGWNDNGDAENDGYWILRNSWGTSWGENGYMRIKYTSARVSCSAAYLTYNAPSGDGGTLPAVNNLLLGE